MDKSEILARLRRLLDKIDDENLRKQIRQVIAVAERDERSAPPKQRWKN